MSEKDSGPLIPGRDAAEAEYIERHRKEGDIVGRPDLKGKQTGKQDKPGAAAPSGDSAGKEERKGRVYYDKIGPHLG